MANKIGDFDSRPVRTGGGRPTERADLRAKAEQPAAPIPGDSSVTLTDAARRLAALERVVASIPEVDAARVAELRRAINSGRYAVDAERIASRLLDIERELSAVMPPSR